MKILNILLLIQAFLFQSCTKPKGSVFEDHRLSEEVAIKFCLVGDIGRNNEHQELMVEALKAEECHRIFFLGNLVYPAGISSVNDPNLESLFTEKYLALFEKPQLIINLLLGPVDYKGDPMAWQELSLRDGRFFFPSTYYLVDYGGLCFVALDTNVGTTEEQTQWLEAHQRHLDNCDLKVALGHQSPSNFLPSEIVGKYDLSIGGEERTLTNLGEVSGTRLFMSGAGSDVSADGRAGFLVLRWEPQNPKRIGYRLNYIEGLVK